MTEISRIINKTININAPALLVWSYLTRPALMKKWMLEEGMVTDIITNWEVGNPILIKGLLHSEFENQGIILKSEPGKILSYSHLSSLSNLAALPENFCILSFNLNSNGEQTELNLVISNFPTETIFKHLDFYWGATLHVIKNLIEKESAHKL